MAFCCTVYVDCYYTYKNGTRINKTNYMHNFYMTGSKMCTFAETIISIFIRRIREKYESEMREVEQSERQAMEKYNEMKVTLLLVEFMYLKQFHLHRHIIAIIKKAKCHR